jgi:hypothetical protein
MLDAADAPRLPPGKSRGLSVLFVMHDVSPGF